MLRSVSGNLRTFPDNLSVPSSEVCPETSVRNCHYMTRDIAEECRSHDRSRPHPQLCTVSAVETVGNKATSLLFGLNAVHLAAGNVSPGGTTGVFPHVMLQRFNIGLSLYCHLRPQGKIYRSLESRVHNTQTSH
jgi:hypothetical protein